MKKITFITTLLVVLFWSGINAQNCNVTLPFADSFEADTVLDPCWTVISVDTSSGLPQYGVTNELSSDGNQSLGLSPYWDPNYDLYLITPELPVSGTKSVTFDHCGYFSTETFVVGYSTTTNDPSDFIWGAQVSSPAVSYPWNHYQNVTVPGNAKYIAIHYAGGIILFIDNFVVEEVASCMAPIDLSASNITATSADLSWVQSGSDPNVTLFYTSTADTNVYELENVTLTDGVYTFAPLTENATYSWMLAVICNGDTLFSDVHTFSTPCAPISTLPFVENFDSTEVYYLPSCWRSADPSLMYPMVSTLSPHSGHSMEFSVSFFTSSNLYAIMPAFSTSLSDLQLSFWTRRGDATSGTFQVGYVTDLNDMAGFVEVWSVTASEIGDNSYHNYLVNFAGAPSSPDTTCYIVFRYSAAEYSKWFLDDVTVELAPPCALPDGLTVNALTDTTAELGWNGDADAYVLFYRVAGASTWTEASPSPLTGTTCVLGGLMPNTDYQWYVAAVCADTLVNSFSISTFTTHCSVFPIPYLESFTVAAAMPDCWARYSGILDATLTVTDAGWAFGNTNALGSWHASLNIAGTDCHHWLVSPAIDLTGLSLPVLTFDMALTSHNSAAAIANPTGQADDKFVVLVSTDNGVTWDAGNAFVWSNQAGNERVFNQIPAAGQTVTLPLADYYNTTVRIAFYGESTVADGDNDLHIDNISVAETTDCPAPSMLTVDATTDSTVSISWSENGDAVSWIVEYGPAGFAPGAGQTLTVNGSPSVTITNLQDLTDYDVYVSSVCGHGLQSDAVSGSFQTKLTPVALPYSTDFSVTGDRRWILNNGSCANYWTMGATDVFPGALYITHDGTDPGYLMGNHVSLVTAVKNLIVGDNEEIKVCFDVMIGGEGMFDFIKLFLAPDSMEYPASGVVYNVNYASASYSAFAYDFTDYLHLSTYHSYPYKFNLTDSNTVHIEAVMPNPNLNATAASTAKLVFLWRNDNSGGKQPGAVISNVSVAAVTCPKPTGLSLLSVSDTSAAVTWTAGSGQAAWNVEYKSAGAGSWTAVTATTNSSTLTGLTPATAYTLRVQTNCGNGDFSAFQTISFTTDSAVTLENPTVTTLSAVNVTEVGATMRGAISNPDSVTITAKGFVWNPSLGVDEVVFVTNNSDTMLYALVDLLPATTYTYCAFIEYGDTIVYGENVTFTTETMPVEPCEVPTDLSQIISSKEVGGINVSWVDHAGVSQWNLQYRPLNGEWVTVLVTGYPSYSISGLVNGELYEIRVQAVCDGGVTSEWSAILTATATNSGIEDWLENSVTLFPNPAKEVINVECTMNNVQFEVETVEVYDVYGKWVNTVVVNENPIRINVSNLADGMYFVRVTTEKGAVTKRFVKR